MMENPWDLDKDEVPDEAGIRESDGRLKIAGTILWGSLFVFLGLLVMTDVAAQDLRDILSTAVVVVASVALTVALGWLAYFVIRHLGLVGGTLFGIGFLFLLALVFPSVWQVLTEETDLVSGLLDSVFLREPTADLLWRNVDSGSVLPITDQ